MSLNILLNPDKITPFSTLMFPTTMSPVHRRIKLERSVFTLDTESIPEQKMRHALLGDWRPGFLDR